MDLPLACSMGALNTAEQQRRQALAVQLRGVTQEVQERPDGYAFRYPASSLLDAAEFVSLERRCCPFFRFGLDVSPDSGSLWLSLTGQDGVKAFLEAEFSDALAAAGPR